MNNILSERYASPEMAHIFSKENRYGKWRYVWLALAEAQSELGFPVKKEDLPKLWEKADQIDFERVKEIEADTRHDVMAHLKYWAEICPEVNFNIHLGATSCFVTDNAESMLYKEALHFLSKQLEKLKSELVFQIAATADQPTLGYTHFQPASPTTIGKRIAMWMQDIIEDYDSLVYLHDNMLCRGAKGTTGTQASYLELVNGDADKVRQLDRLIAKKLKFKGSVELSGQTISRKQDVKIADVLSQIAISLSKMGNDVRLLSHTGDLREGFSSGQIGSSAMPYKQNPMKAERLCSLTRLIPQYREMLTQTAMSQWLERSLDDSAARRVAIPDMFLAINGAINTAIQLINGLCPIPTEDFDDPFLASELLLANAVMRGFNRQEAHERLKNYSLEAKVSDNPKMTFYLALRKDEIWKDDELAQNINVLKPKDLIGLAEEQALSFIKRHG